MNSGQEISEVVETQVIALDSHTQFLRDMVHRQGWACNIYTKYTV